MLSVSDSAPRFLVITTATPQNSGPVTTLISQVRKASHQEVTGSCLKMQPPGWSWSECRCQARVLSLKMLLSHPLSEKSVHSWMAAQDEGLAQHSDLVLLRLTSTRLILTSGLHLIAGGVQGKGLCLHGASHVARTQEMVTVTDSRKDKPQKCQKYTTTTAGVALRR